jgi:Mrp family chromosome partitioning ATPase
VSRNFELLERAAKERNLPGAFRVGVTQIRPILPDPDAHSLSREELMKLVQRTFLLNRDRARAVVFTSVEPRAGCTSICAGAGGVLDAEVDGPVCLVDANLHRPALHSCFGTENYNGLTDAIFKPGPIREFVHKLPGRNLWLLPSGSMASRLSATMKTGQLQSRLGELRKEFAFVLIDAPSVNGYPDPMLLGRLADGVVLVLESNATRRQVARIVKEDFEAAHVRLLGAVLNKRTFPIPQFLYERL